MNDYGSNDEWRYVITELIKLKSRSLNDALAIDRSSISSTSWSLQPIKSFFDIVILIQLTKSTLSTQNTVESSMNPSDNIDITTTINGKFKNQP